MTKKIFHSTLFMACLSLLAGIALIMGILYNYFSKLMTNELSNEAYYIKTGIELNGLDYLQSLPISDNKRITLIASDGTVIFDSEADITEMDNHADRKEFADALNTGVGTSARYSKTLSTKTIYYALRLSDSSVLRTAYTQYTIWSLLINMLPPMILAFIAVILVSSLFSSMLSKRILQPINKIDLNNPDIKEGYDEFIPLIRKINNQNEMIKNQIDEIKRNQENFKAITENMSEGLLVIDKSGTLLSYNSAALYLLGASAPSETAVNILMLNRNEAFRVAVEQALSGRHSLQKLCIDSSHYQIIANPVYEKGIITGAVIIIMDISEKEQLELLRQEFTSNVSHELKTPLTSISGMSELLMTGNVSKEDTVDFAKSIYEESARLISLINDIIKLSQLDEGIVPTPKESVDLYALSEEILARFKQTADKRGITLELTGESAIIEGVVVILDEMISNLCDNAIKYNKENGRVTVNVSSNADNTAVLTVSDTGIGIPKEHLNRVFERFYRVDKSHSKQIGGTGLGLSIVKHAAAFHNARFTIDSTVGKGTSVSIYFS